MQGKLPKVSLEFQLQTEVEKGSHLQASATGKRIIGEHPQGGGEVFIFALKFFSSSLQTFLETLTKGSMGGIELKILASRLYAF